MARKQCVACGNAQAVRPGGLCNRCFGQQSGVVMPEFPIEELDLNKIRWDCGTQMRVRTDEATVRDYAETFAECKESGTHSPFPPLVVFHDGIHYIPADGFTRRLAARRVGISSLPCEVRPGTLRDALLYACGANASHGLRRSAEDIKHVVLTVLSDEEWAKWSDREISRRCHVSHGTVGKYREQMAEQRGEPVAEERTYTTRTGSTATMNTGPIAARNKAKSEPSEQQSEKPFPQGPLSGQTVQVDGEPTTTELPLLDSVGNKVPPQLRDIYGDRWIIDANRTLEDLYAELRKSGIGTQVRGKASFYPHLDAGPILDKLGEAGDIIGWLIKRLESARPYALCPHCLGKKCDDCRQSGLVPEWRYRELTGEAA